MQTEYDEYLLGYWRLTIGNYSVKSKKDDGLDGDIYVKNSLPSQLGAFILSNIKRNMINFIREVNEFYNRSIY